MKDIKKLMITLVALLAVTTGARADQLASSYSSNATLNAVTVSASMEVTIATGVTVTINNGLNITSGTLTVTGPGTLVVNGKAGSNGYNGDSEGGAGGTGGAAISGNIIVQGGAVVTATGGTGGNGGNGDDEGGNGGNGGVAFAGTLTYKGGTVTATGGNGGSGGRGDAEGGSSGYAGNAFTTSVNFVSSDYILTDGSNAITATQVTSKKKVVISPKVAVNSVTLAPTSATLTLGETETVTLTATVDPTNATDPTVKWNVTAGADKVKLYKDENCSTEVGTAATDVLTVYAKCLAVGEATVSVTSNDDATKTAACTVTVIPSGPEVAWDKAKKTGTFKMPGGNVTLEPEYYPQAALTAAPTAINDVPATTDGAIVEAGTVANIGETTNAQGTVMYYVSPTALDDAALQALAADQWTADVPTAADLAQGQAYVYYYVRGNDGDNDDEIFSDGDILAANKVTVTLGAAPLWNAEFDLTNAPEEDKAGKWSTDIPEGGVVKGTEVKVTYTGTKKVIGVKAEKKAAKPAAEGHALSASVVGEIVGSDGNVYAVADKDNLPEGVTAVAMVAYKSATAGSSLAIALADEGSMNWNSAKSTCASKAAIGGKSWKLPTKDEWEQMFSANGGSTGLKTALSAAGGASSTLQNGYYWSSTEVVLDPEDDPDMAWIYSFGEVRWYWDDMVNGRQVRACLAF